MALRPDPALARRNTVSGCILLAEDEPDVRRVLAKTLRRSGFDVTEAEDGGRALALFEREPHAYDLLVSDVMMPELDGHSAFSRMQQLRPGFAAVFLSGNAPDLPRLEELRRAGSGVTQLGKPVDRAGLLGAINALLDGRPDEDDAA